MSSLYMVSCGYLWLLVLTYDIRIFTWMMVICQQLADLQLGPVVQS